MYLASVHYFDTNSDIYFCFYMEKNNNFCWNRGTSEFPLFVVFEPVALLSHDQIWAVFEGAGSVIQFWSWCYLITILTWRSKELHERVMSLWCARRDIWLTTFQFLYNVSSHWPILLYNPNFCQMQYVNKF